MDIKIIELAAKVMKVPVEEAAKHNKLLPDIDAFYFWNPVRRNFCNYQFLRRKIGGRIFR